MLGEQSLLACAGVIAACDFRVPPTTAMCVSFAENTAGRNVLDTTQLG